MDITAHAVVDTTTLHVRNAAGDPLFDADKQPIRITVYGPASSQYQEAYAARQNKAAKRMQDKGGKIVVTAAQQAEDRTEFLTAITQRFEGIEHKDAPGASGAALFKVVYADPSLGFIAKQVEDHVGDWGNFTRGSQTS